MDGVLIVNKPKNVTSRDVVNSVCKIFNTKKIGHTGTLDPIATGVLVLCIGKYTKLSDELMATKKEYIAEAIIGQDSDTLDNTGIITKDEKAIIKKEEIEKVLKSFVKKYEQTVPIYSAVKINGKKLYDYARDNEQVELPKREIEISEIELLESRQQNNHTLIKFRCVVSKGTYIRSLIRDIGIELKTCAIMSNLTRTKQGPFEIEKSYTIEQISNNEYKFVNLFNYMNDFEKIIVDEKNKIKISNGSILENTYKKEKIAFFDESRNLLALYKKYEKNNTKIKPIKVFS